ncbi:MAG: patatin-like phospholipase family protein [Crocosphaera sp.]|nr:patatin-like phospholipase family protein [Crocosphaera sp.]
MSSLQSVLSFDGKDDYVEIPYQSRLNLKKFTLSCWAKVTGKQKQWRSPVTCRTGGPQGGYILYAGTDNKWQFWIGNGQQWVPLKGSNVVLRAWTHIAATYDGTKMRLYINGEPVGTPINVTLNLNRKFPLRIGAGATERKPTYFFQGQVAEVRLWEQVRSPKEIATAMNQRLTGEEQGLVGYWPLNEGAGRTIQDATGNGQEGRILGATWKQVDLPLEEKAIASQEEETKLTPSSALMFNGTTDYICVADNPSLRIAEYTVELWLKPSGQPNETWKGIVGKPGRNFNIWLHNDGFIHHRFHTNAGWNAGAPNTPNQSLPWDQWSHVAITNDGQTAKTYINGKLVAEGSTEGKLIVDQTPLYIGRDLDGTDERYFKGYMADIRLWNQVRTPEAINGSMNTRLTGTEEGLIAYWPGDEGSGTTLKDKTINNNDGQLFGVGWEKVDLPLEEIALKTETSSVDTAQSKQAETETSPQEPSSTATGQETSGETSQAIETETSATTAIPQPASSTTTGQETSGETSQGIETETEPSATTDTPQQPVSPTTTTEQVSLTPTQEKPQTPMNEVVTPKYKILSIDGGGIRGIIPAIILAEIEKRTGEPIYKLFDIIAGTSTGGLLALGLTKPNPDSSEPTPQYSAEDLINMYVDYGAVIFYESFFEQMLGPFEDIIAGPKFSSEGRDEVVSKFFGETPLQSCLKEVFVTSYDIEQRIPVFFTSQVEKERTQSRQFRKLCLGFTLKDAAMATSAAPTYFEPYHLPTCQNTTGYYTLVDGGMVANNPAHLAIMEAELTERKKGVDLSMNDILVVSLGTGSLTSIYKYEDVKKWGLINWARPLLNIILDGGSELVAGELERILEPKDMDHAGLYYRYQTFLSEEVEAMDNAKPKNLEALKELAHRLIEEKDAEIDQLCEILTSGLST